MDPLENMEARKVSEDDLFVEYVYGHLWAPERMTGRLRISNNAETVVSTVKLEDGYKTRVNEMRIGGKIIIEHLMSGRWPEFIQLQ
ncbi:MAG: hypothetical protein II627_07650 [Lachnospiraceae bacterium]|nr:hypothetical protein [Lachnospiraceae bacterium]